MANANVVNVSNPSLFVNSDDLSEVSPKDKIWDKHRSNTTDVELVYSRNDEFSKYAARIKQCSELLGFAEITDKTTGEINLKLRQANFCRVRTCPVCQWRRSLMWKARFHEALPKLEQKHPKARFLFLTLTVRNCEIVNLRETLEQMHTAFRKLIQRAEIKKNLLGWVRTTEVTRGDDGTAHPHYHCLLMVKAAYFSGQNYIKQERYVELWRQVASLPYSPNVDIRVVKSKSDDGKMQSAIAETLKYTVKASDLVADDEWLYEYTRQIHKLRFVASGGELKNVLKEAGPETDDDLIHIDAENEASDEVDEMRFFHWNDVVRHYKAGKK